MNKRNIDISENTISKKDKKKKDITVKDRVLNGVIIIFLIFIIIVAAYVYLVASGKIHTNTKSTDFETRVVDKYNYIKSYPEVVKNANKNIIEQYSNMNANNSVVSQITIQSMMYNVAVSDNKELNTLFQRYDNGYLSWEKSAKLFDNTKVFYPNERTFNYNYVNNLLSTEIGKTIDIFEESDNELLSSSSAIGLYYNNIEFDTDTSKSLLDSVELNGVVYCANTNNLDIIKLKLKDNKTAVFVTLRDGKNYNIKDCLTELGDLTSLNWYTKDMQIEIYPFSSMTSGVPGSVLTDIKSEMTEWDEKFNELMIVNYIEFNGNATNEGNGATTNDINTSTEDGEIPIENTYAETYVLHNNFIMLIQDNNTKLIECICDVE